MQDQVMTTITYSAASAEFRPGHYLRSPGWIRTRVITKATDCTLTVELVRWYLDRAVWRIVRQCCFALLAGSLAGAFVRLAIEI